MASYVDHVCYKIKDLDWTIDFFGKVFGMPVERLDTAPDGLRNAWLTGGLQLREDPAFEGKDDRHHHLCLLVDDLEDSRAKALEWGCKAMPKHHWVEMPTGLQIEMFQGSTGAVDALNRISRKK